MNTPNFNVDLNSLDIPPNTNWVTQDENGRIDFWEFEPYTKHGSNGGYWTSRHLCIRWCYSNRNDNWKSAITKWPLTEKMNTSHPHAKLMAQYAEDAHETDKPWERWEYCIGGVWFQCREEHMHWNKEHNYRRKPRTININGFEVPKPLHKAPAPGTPIFIATTSSQYRDRVSDNKWTGGAAHLTWLEDGILHLTREAAAQHSKALLSFTKNS